MQIKRNLSGICFQTGYQMIDEQIGVGLVGISLNNSYFTGETINDLIITAHASFKDTLIIIPDTLSIHNYQAMGMPCGKAERIARQKGNNIEKKCLNAIANIRNKKPHVIKWLEIEKNSLFQDQLNNIYQLYSTNMDFKSDARENTFQVIGNKVVEDNNRERAIDEGINYLLKEIAYLMAAAEMLDVPKVAFVYHKQWDFLQNFINGIYDGHIKENIGFAVIS